MDNLSYVILRFISPTDVNLNTYIIQGLFVYDYVIDILCINRKGRSCLL